MNDTIIRNEIDNLRTEYVYNFLKDFKEKICLYCFSQKNLSKCIECNYYFCNDTHNKYSDIILHLKKCGHEKISINDSELKCLNCNSKNIFDLYYNINEKNQIFCEKCIENMEEYTKVVDGRIDEEILSGVDEIGNINNSNFDENVEIINNKIKDFEKYDRKYFLPYVSIKYTKKKLYCQRYISLIKEEIDYIKEENKKEEYHKFKLSFDIRNDKYVVATVDKEIKEEGNKTFMKFYISQYLEIAKETNTNKTFAGKVIEINHSSQKIVIFFKDLEKLLNDGNYLIKEIETIASYERILEALEKFNSFNLFNKNLQLLLLGKEGKEAISNKNEILDQSKLPQKLYLKELDNIRLNESQKSAINNCFRNKLTLIKGPPGTGKTLVLSVLAYHLIKLKKKNQKIWIGAPSNRAVDNISVYFQKIGGIKFVRVLSHDREVSEEVDQFNSLNKLILERLEADSNKVQYNKFKDIYEKKMKYGILSKEDSKLYNQIIDNYQNTILNSCDIILTTTSNAADSRLTNYEFPFVIIDESTQSLEPECLIPIIHHAQMVVMIGDEKQLGPTVLSQESLNCGLSISLFERLSYYYEGSYFISTLTEQYRMHDSLYEFSNTHFYNNQIKTSNDMKIEIDENVSKTLPWPNPTKPLFFYNYTGDEEKSHNSYFNKTEIRMIKSVVYKLIKSGVLPKNIGIITPYNAQKYQLYGEFSNKPNIYEDLRIESVDGFQGMEREYIILSTVRSNDDGNIGFLSEKKRLNVALTRAQKGMIILGNYKCLRKHKGIWRELIDFYFQKGLIYQGPLSNLEKLEPEPEYNNLEEDDEEVIKEKDEKHKGLKKNIVIDYFKEMEIIKGSEKNEKMKELKSEEEEEDLSSAPPIENNMDEEEEKDEEKKEKGKKSKKMKKGKKKFEEIEDRKEEYKNKRIKNKKGEKNNSDVKDGKNKKQKKVEELKKSKRKGKK